MVSKQLRQIILYNHSEWTTSGQSPRHSSRTACRDILTSNKQTISTNDVPTEFNTRYQI